MIVWRSSHFVDILKVEPVGFSSELDVGYERQKKSQDSLSILAEATGAN